MKTSEVSPPGLVPGLVRALRRAADRLDRKVSPNGASSAALEEYVIKAPSVQNAVDSLPGWNMALPPEAGAVAGVPVFFDDPRIHWAADQFGPFAGKSVVELGPLEASHTYILERRGPASLLAIESNRLSFFRCLVVKEALDLKVARFQLGDFAQWLRQDLGRYDFIVASGVLYHMHDPISVLERIAAKTDAVYIWTHYASDEAMPEGDARRMAFVGDPETVDFKGVQVRLRKRSYWGAWRDKAFCGGPYDLHRWIERDSLFALLRALGFDDLRFAHDEPNHKNGPSMSIFARRTSGVVTI